MKADSASVILVIANLSPIALPQASFLEDLPLLVVPNVVSRTAPEEVLWAVNIVEGKFHTIFKVTPLAQFLFGGGATVYNRQRILLQRSMRISPLKYLWIYGTPMRTNKSLIVP